MNAYINLYNPALVKRRDALSGRNVGIAAALAAALVLSVWGVLRSSTAQLAEEAREAQTRLEQEQKNLASLSKAVAERKPDARLNDELLRQQAALKVRREMEQAVATGAAGKTDGFSEHLKAFSRQARDGLWLTGFSIESSGDELEIRGKALKADLLPLYIRSLNSERVFQGRSFAALNVRSVEPQAKTDGSAGAKDEAASKRAALPSHIEFNLSARDKPAKGAE